MTRQNSDTGEQKLSAPVIAGTVFPYSVKLTATGKAAGQKFSTAALMFENGDVLMTGKFAADMDGDLTPTSVTLPNDAELRAGGRAWTLVLAQPTIKNRLKAAVSAYGTACAVYGGHTPTDDNDGEVLFNSMIQAGLNVDALIDQL
uniref:hypothetical protein n=1 Tax=Burkholderia sp. M701 TaxID=326454 RepID=UPI00097F7391|nr:hypothetical protein [Burkholderia sp. M701]